MRKILTLLSVAALISTPLSAQARGFDSDFSATITGPMKLEIRVSDDLAHRANNLPKKLTDRSSSSRLNSSFANNGRYGDKAISHLLEDMNEEITADFTRQGIILSDSAPTVLRITIEKVKPNRPTFKQLSTDASLSFQSFGIGGAEVSADILGANGNVIGSAEYDYYSSLDQHIVRPIGTWADAERAFSRFSRKLSKKLAALGAASS